MSMLKKLSWWKKGSTNKSFDDIGSVGIRGEAIFGKEDKDEVSFLHNVHVEIDDNTSDEGEAKQPNNEFYHDVEYDTQQEYYPEEHNVTYPESQAEWVSPEKENYPETIFNMFSSKQNDDSLSGMKDNVSSPAESKTSAESDAEPEDDEVEIIFSKLRHNRTAYVKEALRDGFSVHSIDSRGNTMLHICAQNDNKKMASSLIKLGCDVNKENKKGLTALDYAHMYKFQGLVELLTDFGADFGSRSQVRGN